MDNRVAAYFGQHPEPKPARVDFWIVFTDTFRIYVDESTALSILEAVDQRFPKIWIRFRDLFGDRMSLRTRHVRGVTQSTTDARELSRRFYRALDAEEPSDSGPWESC